MPLGGARSVDGKAVHNNDMSMCGIARSLVFLTTSVEITLAFAETSPAIDTGSLSTSAFSRAGGMDRRTAEGER